MLKWVDEPRMSAKEGQQEMLQNNATGGRVLDPTNNAKQGFAAAAN